MRPARAPSDNVKSPCSGVCRLTEWAGSLYCVGCWRSKREISAWAALNADERCGVLENVAKRRIYVSILGS